MRFMAIADPVVQERAASARWLSIVGIGEDGISGLSPAARDLVSAAEIVFGGKRHLALAAPLIRGAARPWPSPFERGIEEVLALRGRNICVLASGDPFFFGVGSVLARELDAAEMVVMPAPSAFSLAAARLGWSLPDTVLLSLHGRDIALVRPHLQPHSRILALASDAHTPRAVAHVLNERGFSRSRITLLESLGGPRERVRTSPAAKFDFADVHDLNTVAVQVIADVDARIIPRVAGLADEMFEHDGQITKREIRAVTLSSLAPRRGELLWDIGAGAGSVAIEWMLCDASLAAIAIEKRQDRAARIRRNAAELGVPGLQVIEGAAPGALAGLPAPSAIFIGGGATESGVLDIAISGLKPGGRLVVNAVTLATEKELLARHAGMGGALTRIAIARAQAVGGEPGWRPAMPITQWTWMKPAP
jgi:precorrin-6Y C5,15-methyltransferase (decarboxylating)